MADKGKLTDVEGTPPGVRSLKLKFRVRPDQVGRYKALLGGGGKGGGDQPSKARSPVTSRASAGGDVQTK